MGPNKFVHLTFALAGILAAFLLSRTGDWVWSYFSKPNELAINVFAILVAGAALWWPIATSGSSRGSST